MSLVEGFGREIDRGYAAPIYVGKVDEAVGYRLYAAGAIKTGELIGEYTGLVIGGDSFWSGHSDGTYRFAYPFNGTASIDARERGNLLRFANHSTGRPNAKPVAAYRAGTWHVLLVATKTIPKDGQILFDYGPGYWPGRAPSEL